MSMRRLLVGVLAAGLVTVAAVGCGQSVDAARSEAAARLEGLLFLDEPGAVRVQLEAAASAEEVQKVVDAAERENRERADAYWSCADRAATALPGSDWGAPAWHDDGGWDDVLLSLNDGGAAKLKRLASHPPAGPDLRPTSPPRKMDTWLSENIGRVTGWSSDLTDRVASRTLLDDQPPRFSPLNKTCTVRFLLKLTGSGSESQFTAKLDFRSEGQLSLNVDGKDLPGKAR